MLRRSEHHSPYTANRDEEIRMLHWALIAALPFAFLGGALLVAEYLCRKDAARHRMPWVENTPDDAHELSSD